jgi:hypothetical protein
MMAVDGHIDTVDSCNWDGHNGAVRSFAANGHTDAVGYCGAVGRSVGIPPLTNLTPVMLTVVPDF